MQKRLEVGSYVFIIESNRIITEVVVTANRGDFCVLRFPSGGAIQLRRSRIFASREDAEMQLSKNELEQVHSIALHIIMVIDWRGRW